MSKYTSLLRYICENKSGMTESQIANATIDQIIDAAKANIFDFDFPVHNETFRPVLEHEILFHFYMQEIGAETYGLFKYYLARKLREIMPYYAQLYASAELEFNPLHDVDYSKTHEGTAAGGKNTQSNTSGQTTAAGERDTSGSGQATGTRTENGERNTTGREITDTASETDGTETRTTSGTKSGSTSYTDSATQRNAFSDTPQTSVRGVEGDGSGNNNNVSDNYYLTDYRKITDSKSGSSTASETTSGTESGTLHNEGTGQTVTNTTGNETSTVSGTTTDNTTTAGHEETTQTGTSTSNTTGAETFNNTDAYVEHITGKIGTASYASMLSEFRETFLNINKMVFDELECCFMQIY